MLSCRNARISTAAGPSARVPRRWLTLTAATCCARGGKQTLGRWRSTGSVAGGRQALTCCCRTQKPQVERAAAATACAAQPRAAALAELWRGVAPERAAGHRRARTSCPRKRAVYAARRSNNDASEPGVCVASSPQAAQRRAAARSRQRRLRRGRHIGGDFVLGAPRVHGGPPALAQRLELLGNLSPLRRRVRPRARRSSGTHTATCAWRAPCHAPRAGSQGARSAPRRIRRAALQPPAPASTAAQRRARAARGPAPARARQAGSRRS